MTLAWDDLRYFLAVARGGSTAAGAKLLGVDQTTVARRIAALESSVGLILFERRRLGYALTAAGAAMVPDAEAMERAAAGFTNTAMAAGRDLHDTVRLSTVEVYAAALLTPLLSELRTAHPSIRIEIDATEAKRDLGNGEADIALRGGHPPEGEGLVGRLIGADPWTLYCSRDYADRHGLPTSFAQLAAHPLIGGGGDHVWPMYRRWLQQHALEDAVVLEHGSTSGLLSAVKAGLGLAVLPSLMADREADLVQVVSPRRADGMELWLLTHERVRHAPRVRAVMDFLGSRLQDFARQPISAGRPTRDF